MDSGYALLMDIDTMVVFYIAICTRTCYCIENVRKYFDVVLWYDMILSEYDAMQNVKLLLKIFSVWMNIKLFMRLMTWKFDT